MPRHPPITDSFPDFTGKILADGLLLQDVLGAGAYGKVYRALDTTSPLENRHYYAVKCLLKPQMGSREEDFQRREFTLHRKVSGHRNIVGFRNVYYEDKFVYVVLDLCSGGDMFSAITVGEIFKQNDELLRSIFCQLLDAVHYCHENAVFHRDLKPENILLCEDNTVARLADFGLSTDKKESKDFGCGSSYYMSPECIGKEMGYFAYSTKHSDIWSLGIILVNMMTGRNPWRYAMTTDDCFAAFLNDPKHLCAVLPISNGANRLLCRIFNLNPLGRITIPELKKEILRLDTFFARESILPDPIVLGHKSVSEPHKRKVQRHEDSFQGESTSSEGTATTMDSEEVYLYPSPAEGVDPLSPEEAAQAALERLAVVASGTDSSSSSDPDSDGPITPAQRPVDPAIEVPDITPGQGIGRRLIQSPLRQHLLPKLQVVRFATPAQPQRPPRHRAPSSNTDKPPPRRSQFFRKARQLLGGVPGSTSS